MPDRQLMLAAAQIRIKQQAPQNHLLPGPQAIAIRDPQRVVPHPPTLVEIRVKPETSQAPLLIQPTLGHLPWAVLPQLPTRTMKETRPPTGKEAMSPKETLATEPITTKNHHLHPLLLAAKPSRKRGTEASLATGTRKRKTKAAALIV